MATLKIYPSKPCISFTREFLKVQELCIIHEHLTEDRKNRDSTEEMQSQWRKTKFIGKKVIYYWKVGN